MTKFVLFAAVSILSLGVATTSFAQQGPGPGIDLGPLHTMLPSPVPVQVTTYEPPPSVYHRRHRRVR